MDSRLRHAGVSVVAGTLSLLFTHAASGQCQYEAISIRLVRASRRPTRRIRTMFIGRAHLTCLKALEALEMFVSYFRIACMVRSRGRHRFRVARASVVLAAAASPMPHQAVGQCRYAVTVFDARPCFLGSPSTIPQALNDFGDVVGKYRHCTTGWDEAFFWNSEQGFVTLERPAGVIEATAEDINNAGQIVGTLLREDVSPGFVFEDGKFFELVPAHDGVRNTPLAINNHGAVVGRRSFAQESLNGYFWSPSTGYADFGLMGVTETSAIDVNDLGVVVGKRGFATTKGAEGFLWHKGALTFLGLIPDGSTSVPVAVNYRSDVAVSGHRDLGGNLVGRGYVWADGVWKLVQPPGEPVSWNVSSLNDLGQVVGATLDGVHDDAFLWQNGSAWMLDDLIDPDLEVDIRVAKDINNVGQIAAYASVAPLGIAGVLLTPIDRPAGDIDGNCNVGFTDVLIVLNRWHTSDPYGDVDASGLVDVADLLLVLSHWG